MYLFFLMGDNKVKSRIKSMKMHIKAINRMPCLQPFYVYISTGWLVAQIRGLWRILLQVVTNWIQHLHQRDFVFRGISQNGTTFLTSLFELCNIRIIINVSICVNTTSRKSVAFKNLTSPIKWAIQCLYFTVCSLNVHSVLSITVSVSVCVYYFQKVCWF